MTTEPRTVTLEQIEAEIVSERCFTAADAIVGHAVSHGDTPTYAELRLSDGPLGLLTFCVLVLRNGFTVTGQSACADPRKFNAVKGRELARADAIRQCWALLGFRLRDQMAAGPLVDCQEIPLDDLVNLHPSRLVVLRAPAPAQPERKRYTHEDIVDLNWTTPLNLADPLDDGAWAGARMQDGAEFRVRLKFEAWSAEPMRPAHEVAKEAILVAANGEAA